MDGKCVPLSITKPKNECGKRCEMNPCPQGHLQREHKENVTKVVNGIKWLEIKTEKVQCKDEIILGYLDRHGTCVESKPKCGGSECSAYVCADARPTCEGMDVKVTQPNKTAKTVEGRCCKTYQCSAKSSNCGEPCEYNPCPPHKFHKKSADHKEYKQKGLRWENDTTYEILCLADVAQGYYQRDGKCGGKKPSCSDRPEEVQELPVVPPTGSAGTGGSETHDEDSATGDSETPDEDTSTGATGDSDTPDEETSTGATGDSETPDEDTSTGATGDSETPDDDTSTGASGDDESPSATGETGDSEGETGDSETPEEPATSGACT